MFKNLVLMIVAMTALAAFASCGGAAFTDVNGGALAGATIESPAVDSALPALPLEQGGVVTRGASDIVEISGAVAIASFGATVQGEELVLQSTETEMAWALYKVEGLAGREVTGLSVEAMPGTMDSQYGVGVSNFSDGVWDFLAYTSLPEFEYDLSTEQSRLVSQLGNLYFVVAVGGGASATVHSASLFSVADLDGESDLRPEAGSELVVSEGLPDRIELSWLAIAGATSYEIWRQADVEGEDESWETIGTTSELSFSDMTMQLDTEYKYMVRGISEAGAGGFTDDESGYAGNAPAGEDESGDDNGSGVEPGDDNGGDGVEPGDDNGGDGVEPGDDNGGDGVEPGDDNGGDGVEPGDDNGGDDAGDDNGGQQ